jgi:hypothetical protein
MLIPMIPPPINKKSAFFIIYFVEEVLSVNEERLIEFR